MSHRGSGLSDGKLKGFKVHQVSAWKASRKNRRIFSVINTHDGPTTMLFPIGLNWWNAAPIQGERIKLKWHSECCLHVSLQVHIYDGMQTALPRPNKNSAFFISSLLWTCFITHAVPPYPPHPTHLQGSQGQISNIQTSWCLQRFITTNFTGDPISIFTSVLWGVGVSACPGVERSTETVTTDSRSLEKWSRGSRRGDGFSQRDKFSATCHHRAHIDLPASYLCDSRWKCFPPLPARLKASLSSWVEEL